MPGVSEKPTTVYVDEDQIVKLRELKRVTGVPMAEFIRQGVDAILEKNRHILEEDPALNFIRASGDCTCEVCGDTYYHHPRDMKNLGYDDQPYLRILCGGQRVKL